MATITNTQILTTPIGPTQVEVVFVFTLDNGETITDGPRVFSGSLNLSQAATVIGALELDWHKTDEMRNAVFTYPWDYTLKYATALELASYVRQLYKDNEKTTLVLVAIRILEWISNGRFTDTQVQNVFGLSAAQWTTLKTKMQNFVDSYTIIDGAIGE